jgi:hypothetical protein
MSLPKRPTEKYTEPENPIVCDQIFSRNKTIEV